MNLRRLRKRIERPALSIRARGDAKRALSRIAALRGLTLGRALMVKEGRAVFLGQMDGRSVVVKVIRDEARAFLETRAGWEALTRAQRHMNHGPHQVPEPIHAAPGRGTLVMGLAEGERLTEALRKLPLDRAAALTRHAADWLESYCWPERRTGALATEFWIAQREARTSDIADPKRRLLARKLMVSLKMQAARLHHVAVTKVVPHGDFWSHNLIWDGVVMTGVDLTIKDLQPIARDPARFLVHQSLNMPSEKGPWRYGLPAHWVHAFADAPLLASEADGVLRFFIGVELHHRLLSQEPSVRVQAETLAILERYLASPA